MSYLNPVWITNPVVNEFFAITAGSRWSADTFGWPDANIPYTGLFDPQEVIRNEGVTQGLVQKIIDTEVASAREDGRDYIAPSPEDFATILDVFDPFACYIIVDSPSTVLVMAYDNRAQAQAAFDALTARWAVIRDADMARDDATDA